MHTCIYNSKSHTYNLITVYIKCTIYITANLIIIWLYLLTYSIQGRRRFSHTQSVTTTHPYCDSNACMYSIHSSKSHTRDLITIMWLCLLTYTRKIIQSHIQCAHNIHLQLWYIMTSSDLTGHKDFHPHFQIQQGAIQYIQIYSI